MLHDGILSCRARLPAQRPCLKAVTTQRDDTNHLPEHPFSVIVEHPRRHIAGNLILVSYWQQGTEGASTQPSPAPDARVPVTIPDEYRPANPRVGLLEPTSKASFKLDTVYKIQ